MIHRAHISQQVTEQSDQMMDDRRQKPKKQPYSYSAPRHKHLLFPSVRTRGHRRLPVIIIFICRVVIYPHVHHRKSENQPGQEQTPGRIKYVQVPFQTDQETAKENKSRGSLTGLRLHLLSKLLQHQQIA